MRGKRPCRYCHQWFRPDKRVEGRQVSCSKVGCQRRRKDEAQSLWVAANPSYFHERWLRKRSEAAVAAEEAVRNPRQLRTPEGAKDPVPRRPSATRMWAPLDQVPWDLVQDEIGVQVTDVIGLVAKVLLTAVQDEIRVQVAEHAGDRSKVLPSVDQDKIAAPAS